MGIVEEPPVGFARRMAAALVSTALTAAGVVVLTPAADAAVIRPFTLNYDKEVYGDFLESGNGVVRCPDPTDPDDPNGEVKANCATSQAGNPPNSTSGNDAYYMRWADID